MVKYGPTIVSIVEIAVWLAVCTFFGSWTYSIAKRKNRTKWGWFLIGFSFNLPGVIVAVVMPTLPSRVSVPAVADSHRQPEQETSPMASADLQSRDIAWRRALFAGAVAGGLGYGLVAADVFVTPFEGTHYGTLIEPRMIIAAIVSILCVVIAVTLVALSRGTTPARSSVMFTAALALVVAVASGWTVSGLQTFQLAVSGNW